MAGARLHLAWRRIPFLVPINSGCTDHEPARSVYGSLPNTGSVCVSLAMGFPATDFAECGPSVWAYGDDAEAAQRAVDTVHDDIVAREASWQVRTLAPDAAVAEATRIAAGAAAPVVIADTQDNPGTGGDARTTGMVRALLDAEQPGAVAAVWDPAAAAAAHAAGIGGTVRLALGGHPGIAGAEPLVAEFHVEHLADGRCRFEGPMMHGTDVDCGPSVCLRTGAVRIGVTSRKVQLVDRSQLQMLGIDLERVPIVVVKSSVHFRASFEPVTAAILVAAAPGPVPADPADVPWTKLRPDVRTGPLGPVMAAAEGDRG